MKLLDRYVLTLFLKNYVISLTVLIGLYIVMDMVFKFDDIVRIEKTTGEAGFASLLRVAADVGSYYFYQSFLIFVMMSGIIPVVAAAFTLMRLSRFNELTAFLAAGVPMLRLALPVILASVVLNMLLYVDQEFVIPQMVPQLVRSNQDMHQAAVPWFQIKSMQVGDRSVMDAARYHPATATDAAYMEDMDVIDRDDNLEMTGLLSASVARWNGHDWTLENGRYKTGLGRGQSPSDEKPTEVYPGGVSPEEITLYRGSSSIDLLSTRRINELIARPKSYGVAGLYKIKNLRLTQPFMNVLLLLLTIPTVMNFDPKALKTSATKCLTVMALAMTSVFICQQMANTPPLGPGWVAWWPALMAWVPIFLFAPLAGWTLDRIKT